MRSYWGFAWLVVALVSCRVYVQRPPDEVAQLPSSIYSLPESLLVLSGDGYIVSYSEIHTKTINILNRWHWIHSQGRIGISHPFIHHAMLSGYVDLSAVEGLVQELNSIGYFSVTEEVIATKIMKKQVGCLSLLYSDPGEWPRYEIGDTLSSPIHTSTFHFAPFTHKVSYQVGEEERWPYVKELEILSWGMELIKNFMREKYSELRHDSIPESR